MGNFSVNFDYFGATVGGKNETFLGIFTFLERWWVDKWETFLGILTILERRWVEKMGNCSRNFDFFGATPGGIMETFL